MGLRRSPVLFRFTDLVPSEAPQRLPAESDATCSAGELGDRARGM